MEIGLRPEQRVLRALERYGDNDLEPPLTLGQLVVTALLVEDRALSIVDVTTWISRRSKYYADMVAAAACSLVNTRRCPDIGYSSLIKQALHDYAVPIHREDCGQGCYTDNYSCLRRKTEARYFLATTLRDPPQSLPETREPLSFSRHRLRATYKRSTWCNSPDPKDVKHGRCLFFELPSEIRQTIYEMVWLISPGINVRAIRTQSGRGYVSESFVETVPENHVGTPYFEHWWLEEYRDQILSVGSLSAAFSHPFLSANKFLQKLCRSFTTSTPSSAGALRQ